jgi:catechol 2,3-dioxygenase-like lactoylglutathione lyase family enzyme
MAAATVEWVRSIDFGVPDPKASAKFYTDAWGLTPVLDNGTSIYLRGTGQFHHVIALHKRPTAALLRVDLTARDRATLDALHAQVKATGVREIDAPAAIKEPGGGYGFTFKDPEGRIIRILTGDQRHADASEKPDLPSKITHVVLNTTDRTKSCDFYGQALGFKVVDRTKFMSFLRCNDEHHSIAFAQGDAATLNHIAFMMKDLESVMRGAGRLKDKGYSIDWGVGRHGPGNNVFAYFVGPDNVVVEYTSEVQRIDDSYKAGGPEDWTWPPGRIDRWGIAVGPTDRMKAAQKQIGFAPELFHSAA